MLCLSFEKKNGKEAPKRSTVLRNSANSDRWRTMTAIFTILILLLQLTVACNSTTDCCPDNELIEQGQDAVTIETDVDTGTVDAQLATERSRFQDRLNFTRGINFPNFTNYGEDLPPLGDPGDIADLRKQNEGLPDECRSGEIFIFIESYRNYFPVPLDNVFTNGLFVVFINQNQ